jgi:hypothetical protein
MYLSNYYTDIHKFNGTSHLFPPPLPRMDSQPADTEVVKISSADTEVVKISSAD